MPSPTEQRKVLPTQEARQGKELGSVRYVLALSLGLCVIAGLVVYYLLLG